MKKIFLLVVVLMASISEAAEDSRVVYFSSAGTALSTTGLAIHNNYLFSIGASLSAYQLCKDEKAFNDFTTCIIHGSFEMAVETLRATYQFSKGQTKEQTSNKNKEKIAVINAAQSELLKIAAGYDDVDESVVEIVTRIAAKSFENNQAISFKTAAMIAYNYFENLKNQLLI